MDRISRIWLGLAAVSGALALAADVAGRHLAALNATGREFALTGARFGFVHALALMAAAMLRDRTRAASVAIAGWSFVAGQIFFSWSLYAAGFGLASWPSRLVIPGLVLLAAGWLALLVHAGTARKA